MWAKKVFKIYKGLKYLETRKYHAGFFSKQLKGLAMFFAIKHQLVDYDKAAKVFASSENKSQNDIDS